MLHLLRNLTYTKLFCAQVVALLGTGLLTVALGLFAFDIAGDAAGSVLGTALTIKMFAYVGVAPFTAAISYRLPAKAVLAAADAVRLAITLALPLVTEAWQIYLLVFVLQSASATFTPAFQALIPTVLPATRDYTKALSLSRLAYDLESLLSPAIAAALLTVLSYHRLFLGTAAGFALSAALVLSCRVPAHTDQPAAITFWQRLALGVKVFASVKTLRFLLLTNIVVAAGTAIVLVNSVVYVKSLFRLGDAALALTLACYGIGSLVAALTLPWLAEWLGVIRTMIAGSCTVTAGLIAATVITVGYHASGIEWSWLLATGTVLGMGTSLVNTPASRLLVDASTGANRTLVYTAQFALSHACFLLAYPIAGWLGAANLTVAAVALTVIALFACSIAIGFATIHRLRTSSDDQPPVSTRFPAPAVAPTHHGEQRRSGYTDVTPTERQLRDLAARLGVHQCSPAPPHPTATCSTIRSKPSILRSLPCSQTSYIGNAARSK